MDEASGAVAVVVVVQVVVVGGVIVIVDVLGMEDTAVVVLV